MKDKNIDKKKKSSEEISHPPDNVADSTIQNSTSHNQLLHQSLDASIQQRLNEFRNQFAEVQSTSTNRLLFIICIALLLFIILIPIAIVITGYIVYNEIDDVRKSALVYVKNAEQEAIKAENQTKQAEEYLREIEKYYKQLGIVISELTSKDFSNENKVEIINNSIQEIKKNPEFTREEKAIVEAYILQKDGNITQAIEKWRSIANTTKSGKSELVSRAFFSIGYLHTLQDERDQALSAFDEAIKLNPNLIEAYTNRALLNSSIGRPEKALEDYNTVIHLKPDLAEAYINRGILKGSVGKYEDAIKDYDEALRINPNSPSALTNRGIAKSAEDKHQQAIEDFNKAIQLDSGYVDAYINRGSAKRALGMNTDANEDINIALQLSKYQ